MFIFHFMSRDFATQASAIFFATSRLSTGTRSNAQAAGAQSSTAAATTVLRAKCIFIISSLSLDKRRRLPGGLVQPTHFKDELWNGVDDTRRRGSCEAISGRSSV